MAADSYLQITTNFGRIGRFTSSLTALSLYEIETYLSCKYDK